MKVMLSEKFKWEVLCFCLFSLFSLTASAQESPSSKSIEARLSTIEKKLSESEDREKKILENQAKIFDDLQKLRVLVRRS